MMEGRLFFEFLQVAIGIRESLSVAISDADWHRLFNFCKRQALIGIGFTAVERLHEAGFVCPATLRMQWYGYAIQIERMNEKLNRQCRKLVERFEHDGFACCILKGQSNQINYPEKLKSRRLTGDIDVWAMPLGNEECRMKNEEYCTADAGITIAVQTGKEDIKYVTCHGHRAVIEYVRMQFRLQGIDANPKACYHHIEAPAMDGTEVEVHYRPAFLRSPLRNWRMQRWFENHTDECMKNKTHLGFSMMTSSVNVVYQMCHLYTHIFEGGFGLRQLMDYYFALRVWHNDVMECKDLQSQGMWSEGLGTPVMSATEIMAVLRSFGMGKFAAAVMYVLQEAFENEECRNNVRRPKGKPMKNEKLGIERELPQIYSHIANIKKSSSSSASFRELKEIGPQADGDEGSGMPRNGQEFNKNNCAPWMICEPNEVEGRKLLAEIMQGGNFGQYDTRDAALKKGGMVKHGVWKLKRVMRLVSSYPEEALWEPVFRVWHLVWRKING